MKIVKIVLISFLVLIVLIVSAAVIFIKTLDVNRYKPQIIGMAAKALNRPIDFARLDLGISLAHGVNLKISNLTVADDPGFQKGDFLAVRGISLAIDALGFLIRKEIAIPRIGIETARLVIIKAKDGSLNVQTLAQSGAGAASGQGPDRGAAALAVPAFLISSLTGSNSSLSYIDRQSSPPLSFEITAINFTVKKISLVRPFPFVIEASVLSPKQNIRIEGTIGIDARTLQLVLSDLQVTSDLSLIALDKVPASFPMVQKQALPSTLKGKMRIAVSKLSAGSTGLGALAATADIESGLIEFREMASPVKDISLGAAITEKDVRLEKAVASIGSGSIKAAGTINDYLAAQTFDFIVEAQNLGLQDLIAQGGSPVKIEGVAAGRVAFRGKGFSPEALRSGLSGSANLSVARPKLKDLNVLRTVLDKVSVIPGLSEKIEASLPDRFKKKLTQKDTVFSDIDLPAVIENGQCIIKDLRLAAEEFAFRGKAQAGFDGAYALEGAFLIPAELSAAMVTAVPQLQYLQTDTKEIYIPLKISGKAGAVKFTVDTAYIAEKLLATQAKQQIYKALDRALGGKKTEDASGAANTTQSDPTPAPDQAQNTTTQDPLKDLLGTIFK